MSDEEKKPRSAAQKWARLEKIELKILELQNERDNLKEELKAFVS